MTWGLIVKVMGGVMLTTAFVGLLFKVFSFIQVHDNTAREVVELKQEQREGFDMMSMAIQELTQKVGDIDKRQADRDRRQEAHLNSYINYVKNNAKTMEEGFMYLQDFMYDIKRNGGTNPSPAKVKTDSVKVNILINKKNE